ncbi:MAG: hypothetical protein V3T70_11290, partial [Phycisphaerae bacterium]
MNNGVVSLDTAFTDGLYWKQGGNAGTTPGTNVVGTTDAIPLELHVDGARALRLEPTANCPNLIGGFSGNTVGDGVVAATIAGGGPSDPNDPTTGNFVFADYGTIGGGESNEADGSHATIGGGEANNVPNNTSHATIGGGKLNVATGTFNTIGGGESNEADGSHVTIRGGEGNEADGSHATIGGGRFNTPAGDFGTIAGGDGNAADGSHSSVAGGEANFARRAHATIGGGFRNMAEADSTTIGGGYGNT